MPLGGVGGHLNRVLNLFISFFLTGGSYNIKKKIQNHANVLILEKVFIFYLTGIAHLKRRSSQCSLYHST